MLVRSHVQDKGWLDWVECPRQSGTTGESLRLEAFELQLDDIPNLGVSYSAHLQDIGWTEPVVSNQICGTVGEGRRIESIQAQLYGDEAQNYDIWYHSYVEDYGWLQWSKNGEPNGTVGGSKRLEAVSFLLVKKDHATPVVTPPPLNQENPRITIQNIALGEIGYRSNPDYGEVSKYSAYFGTTGEYCSMFVAWCASQAGLNGKYPRSAWVPDCADWYLYHDQAYFFSMSSGYVPFVGDQVFFDYNVNGTPDHTGLVLSCDGHTLNTVEGNTMSPRGVYHKSYNLDDPNTRKQIYGFGVPAF